MDLGAALVMEVEEAVSKGSSEQRVAALRRVASLFVDQSPRLSGEHVDVFDQVIGQLAQQIAFSARVALSEQLASAAHTPQRVARDLVLDPSIDIAGPLLKRAASLDPETLMEVAQNGSDRHLAAIALRPVVEEPVSAAIVLRGSLRTVRALVTNQGAKLNGDTVKRIAAKAEEDAALGAALLARSDIPPFARASIVEEAKRQARRQLRIAETTAGLPEGAIDASVEAALTRAARQPSTLLFEADFTSELELCQGLHDSGLLTEERICDWFGNGEVKNAVAAISVVSAMPIELLARAYGAAAPEPMMFIVKAAQLNWLTYKAFLAAKSGQDITQAAHKGEFDAFPHLSVSTAQRSVRFMIVRGRLFTEKA